MIRAVLILVLGLSAFLQSCCPANTEGVRESTPEEQAASGEEIVNLCGVLQKPAEYSDKVIELETALYRIGGQTSVGDAGCIHRHPLVDVEFEADFVERVCKTSNQAPELCTLVQDHVNGVTDSRWELRGVYRGLFEAYESDGFTLNGLRFRFTIDDARVLKTHKITVETIGK